MSQNVLIAGAGVAAAAAASRLLDTGYGVLLLRKSPSVSTGAEILPPEATAQIEALSWKSVCDLAGATTVEGFENLWNFDEPFVKPGPFLHVERAALAQAALAFAVQRGALVQDVGTLPSLGLQDEECVSVRLDGIERRFLAAIDATGRAAAWSRPVRRRELQIAHLFEGPVYPSTLRGRVVRDPRGKRWAYRVGLPGSTSVGIVGSGESHSELDPSLAQSLGLRAERFRFVGRRPAFPQWALEPVCGRRFAVGDAAFASDPVAGQGIRFAMASGIAAAAAIDGLARSIEDNLAQDYYREFVCSARDRHLQSLAVLRAGPSPPARPLALPGTLRFTARPLLAAVSSRGTLTPEVAYELPDGALVRWAGGFDLRSLARLAPEPISTAELLQRLHAEGLAVPDARTLLTWCVARKILG
jgi:flavin-dependent dehydrogenase